MASADFILRQSEGAPGAIETMDRGAGFRGTLELISAVPSEGGRQKVRFGTSWWSFGAEMIVFSDRRRSAE